MGGSIRRKRRKSDSSVVLIALPLGWRTHEGSSAFAFLVSSSSNVSSAGEQASRQLRWAPAQKIPSSAGSPGSWESLLSSVSGLGSLAGKNNGNG